jgi:hypothetical protein
MWEGQVFASGACLGPDVKFMPAGSGDGTIFVWEEVCGIQRGQQYVGVLNV